MSDPAAPRPAAPLAPLSGLDRYFGISAQNSSVTQEMRAGLTTFLTMSYILFVNPQVLSTAINVPNAFVQLLMTTAIAAAFGSLVMGVVAKYPFAQAPGMGLNAFFAFTVVQGMGVPWQTALGAVFISGVLFVLLSVLGARQAIVQAIPNSLKFAITGGIGAFLAFLGLKNAGIVIANPATLVGMGSFASPTVWLACVGVILTAALMARRVTGAILYGILATTVLGIVTGAAVYAGGPEGALRAFPGFDGSFLGIFGTPVWPGALVGQMDIVGALGLGLLSVVFTFFFVDFFDATGTLTGLSQRAGFIDAQGNMPRARRLFSMDGLAAMFGAFMGTSTTTAYVESAAGVGEGGRTGLTAVTVAVLFLLSMFLWPLASAIPGAATAPALILVGALMMDGVRHIDWDDIADSLPAFLTIITMPLTFSIANGVSLGVISYCAIKLLSGRAKEVSPILYVVGALLLARYIWLNEG
ncbi:NCS2 family permease (plasmid) [Deinococcus sp. D7000]|uniref:AGZA family xanthine/uracil permease-like MFS transporter n=2 Tax=Deinococcus radiopugnans TaxID=57497 RepID=A0A5C4YBM2_9DEIO|nr:NCS2 family permease [Deinococcus radiopugnans]MBB6015349.1 AGZA family xanthine/uracil permease-like MFS transporter [Deinococcus radiopugnans ATCC 19172]QLG12955.1 NCS2 family permease [Deinococcus sp. D7000]TNM72957.1 NCS2 family permease [Deinococcus radiopugnans ATCC 19172]